ncbi:MAG: endonuclease III domain-containing protein [Acidobacteriota bacterium]
MGESLSSALIELCNRLAAASPDAGWPDDGWPLSGIFQPPSFEVAVGAVLVQNNRWAQVVRSLERLRGHGFVCPASVASAPVSHLAEAVRPSGFSGAKAEALRRLGELWLELGDEPPDRARLLGLKGVGPETADAILLYGFGQPRLIADNYLRRLCGRLGYLPPGLNYESASRLLAFTGSWPTPLLQVFHARVVRFGKEFCRKSPRCGICPLAAQCPRLGVVPSDAALKSLIRKV